MSDFVSLVKSCIGLLFCIFLFVFGFGFFLGTHPGPAKMMSSVWGTSENPHQKSGGNAAPVTPPPGEQRPTGSPQDYIEWVDHRHLQPNSATGRLPAGWRVGFTMDPKKAGIVIDHYIEVPDGVVWAFFDPDPAVLPGKSALFAVPLSNRP